MHDLAEIIRDLLTFIAVMALIFATLLIVISTLPDQNPLKRLLAALSYRVGITLAASALAIPLEPIPGIDAIYDIAAPLALLWVWYTFFRDARNTWNNRWGHASGSTPHQPWP